MHLAWFLVRGMPPIQKLGCICFVPLTMALVGYRDCGYLLSICTRQSNATSYSKIKIHSSSNKRKIQQNILQSHFTEFCWVDIELAIESLLEQGKQSRDTPETARAFQPSYRPCTSCTRLLSHKTSFLNILLRKAWPFIPSESFLHSIFPYLTSRQIVIVPD